MAEKPYSRAGAFRESITIEQPPTTQNTFGENKAYDFSLWTTFCTTRAEKASGPGREFRQTEREISEQFEYFAIRYRSTQPDTTMHVVWKSRRYHIRAVTDVEGARRVLMLTCRLIDGEADT